MTWVVDQRPLMDAIGRLLGPHAEVVLHDLDRDEIVAIVNPFSGREVGHPSLLSELPHADGAGDVIGPYEKVSIDGRRLSSISVVVRDSNRRPRGLLCVNLDRSPVDELLRAARALVGPPSGPRPDALFERDWREQIGLKIDSWCREHGAQRTRLTRADRLEIVRALDGAGLFETRGAAQHVADAFGVSRATAYNLLRKTRDAQH